MLHTKKNYILYFITVNMVHIWHFSLMENMNPNYGNLKKWKNRIINIYLLQNGTSKCHNCGFVIFVFCYWYFILASQEVKRQCEKVVLALLLSWASLIWSSELQTLMSVENISCTTTVVGTLAGHFIYETYFGPIVTQVNPDRFKNRFRTMSSATHKYKSPFNLNSIA